MSPDERRRIENIAQENVDNLDQEDTAMQMWEWLNQHAQRHELAAFEQWQFERELARITKAGWP